MLNVLSDPNIRIVRIHDGGSVDHCRCGSAKSFAGLIEMRRVKSKQYIIASNGHPQCGTPASSCLTFADHEINWNLKDFHDFEQKILRPPFRPLAHPRIRAAVRASEALNSPPTLRRVGLSNDNQCLDNQPKPAKICQFIHPIRKNKFHGGGGPAEPPPRGGCRPPCTPHPGARPPDPQGASRP